MDDVARQVLVSARGTLRRLVEGASFVSERLDALAGDAPEERHRTVVARRAAYEAWRALGES